MAVSPHPTQKPSPPRAPKSFKQGYEHSGKHSHQEYGVGKAVKEHSGGSEFQK